MTAEAITDEPQFDWGELEDDEKVTARSGPVSASRNSRTPSAPGTGRRGRRAGKPRLDTLQRKLSQEMFQAGAMIGMGLPVTGYYACQESDQFTKAVVQLASRRTEWIEALENLADIGPGIMIGRTAMGLGAAIAVDRGRADPEKKFMQFLGVYNAWLKVNDKSVTLDEEGNAYTPPPARSFQPV